MSLFKELHRRNVFRIAALYLVLSWFILKTTHILIDLAGLSVWFRYGFEIVLAIGLPFVLWFAWVYEITPDGLKRESEVEPEKSITSLTARKIDSAILIVLIIAISVVVIDRFGPGDEHPPGPSLSQ